MSARGRTQRAALALGGLLLAVGLGWGIPAIEAHASERARWDTERARLGTPEYDATASDERYASSRAAWKRSALAGHLLGAGLLLFAIGAVRPREQQVPGAPAPRARVVAASLVDFSLALAVLSLAFVDATASAGLAALSRAAPYVSAAPLAPILAGTTPGLYATGLQTHPSPHSLWLLPLWPLLLLAPLRPLPPYANASLPP